MPGMRPPGSVTPKFVHIPVRAHRRNSQPSNGGQAKRIVRKDMADSFNVRAMARDEVSIAVDWAEQEGWNPGIHDAETFYAADPEGFFIGEIGDEPIGCVAVVIYDDTFAFGGLYIVGHEYRARGYGSRIFGAAMARAGNRNVGGDGVVEMQEKYRQRSGFTLAYRNIRFEGRGGGRIPGGPVDLASVPLDRVVAYDRRHFPAPRPSFLKAWIRQQDSWGLAVLNDGGDLAGYGLIRTCSRGYKVGPLFADTPAIADDIFRGLIAPVPGEPIFLDTPEPNAAAVALAVEHHMTPVFETARLYTKAVPDLPLNEIFGVTSFELG
jgi:GNAT superfamily N-acetyltransferase